jgi:hypothetical protein
MPTPRYHRRDAGQSCHTLRHVLRGKALLLHPSQPCGLTALLTTAPLNEGREFSLTPIRRSLLDALLESHNAPCLTAVPLRLTGRWERRSVYAAVRLAGSKKNARRAASCSGLGTAPRSIHERCPDFHPSRRSTSRWERPDASRSAFHGSGRSLAMQRCYAPRNRVSSPFLPVPSGHDETAPPVRARR